MFSNTVDRLRPHLSALLVLTVVFVASRLLFSALGVAFFNPNSDDELYVIHLLDPHALQTHLAESLWYSHIQPPFYNLLIGLGLKLFPDSYGYVFHGTFLLLGLVLTFSIYFLLNRLGVSKTVSVIVSALFSLLPATILFENWLFYDYLLIVCITVLALAFNWFISNITAFRGAIFFGLVAIVILTRSSFHLLWMVAILAGVLLIARNHRRVVLMGFLVPFLLVSTIYVKNIALFDLPSTSSWSGSSLFHMSLSSMSLEDKQQLVSEGKLSKYSYIDPFSSQLYQYAHSLKPSHHYGVGVLDSEYRTNINRGNHYPNLNYSPYLSIGRTQLSDAIAAIKARPEVYAHSVYIALQYFFHPSTKNPDLGSNRQAIAGWDDFVTTVVYGQFGSLFNKFNVGGFLILAYLIAYIYGFVVLISSIRKRSSNSTESTIIFMWFVLLYSTAVHTLIDVNENDRFRMYTDAIVVILVTVFLSQQWSKWRHRLIATR